VGGRDREENYRHLYQPECWFFSTRAFSHCLILVVLFSLTFFLPQTPLSFSPENAELNLYIIQGKLWLLPCMRLPEGKATKLQFLENFLENWLMDHVQLFWPTHPDFIEIDYYNTFDDQWHMIVVTCVTYVWDVCHKCDTHDMCHTVTQCDTLSSNSSKSSKKQKNMTIRDLHIWETMWHYATLWHINVTLNVFQLNRMTAEGSVGVPTYS
jgi:hypothetical protein